VLVIGLLGAILLRLLYSAVGSRWPENYASLRTSLDSYVRWRFSRYLVFRMVPVYLAATVVGVSAHRVGGSPTWAVAIMGVAHATGDARAIVVVCRARHWPRRRALVLLHGVTLVFVAVACGLASLTYSVWASAVPAPQDVLVALWTGVFAALLATAWQRVALFPGGSDPVTEAQRDMGEDVWDYAHLAAEHNVCDADVLRAVLVAESMQRPRWFRRLERAKSRVLPAGSYGVAQMTSDHWLSDRASIDELARSFAGYYPERGQYGYVLRARSEARLERHNPSKVFVSTAMAAHSSIDVPVKVRSERLAPDHRGVVEVTRVGRDGQEWVVKGTVWLVSDRLHWHEEPADRRGDLPLGDGTMRRDWSIRLPLAARRLHLEGDAMRLAAMGADISVSVDLDDP